MHALAALATWSSPSTTVAVAGLIHLPPLATSRPDAVPSTARLRRRVISCASLDSDIDSPWWAVLGPAAPRRLSGPEPRVARALPGKQLSVGGVPRPARTRRRGPRAGRHGRRGRASRH